jgi:hypothetical protein
MASVSPQLPLWGFTFIFHILMLAVNIPYFLLPLPNICSIRNGTVLSLLPVTFGEISWSVPLGLQCYARFLHCPSGVKIYCCPERYSDYNHFSWSLQGLFTRTYSCQVISQGLTIRSVFLSCIPDLTTCVKGPVHTPSTSISCFLNSNHGLLFQTTCNNFSICSFCHSSFTLTLVAP